MGHALVRQAEMQAWAMRGFCQSRLTDTRLYSIDHDYTVSACSTHDARKPIAHEVRVFCAAVVCKFVELTTSEKTVSCATVSIRELSDQDETARSCQTCMHHDSL